MRRLSVTGRPRALVTNGNHVVMCVYARPQLHRRSKATGETGSHGLGPYVAALLRL